MSLLPPTRFDRVGGLPVPHDGRLRVPTLPTTARGGRLCAMTAAGLLMVAVPAMAAQAIALAQVTLHLKDGSVLVGEVVSTERGTIRFRTATLGEVLIEAADVVSREPRGDPGVTHPPESAAQAAAAAPPTARWKRTVRVGAFWTSSPFSQGAVSGAPDALTGAALRLAGQLFHAEVSTSATYAHEGRVASLWADLAFTTTRPFGRQAEAEAVGLQFVWPVTPRTYVSSRLTWDRDAVRAIDDSSAELLGLGVKLRQGPRLTVDLVGGGAVVFEHKATRFDGTWQPQVGVMELVSYQLSPRAAISHWLLYRAGTRQREIWNVESETSLRGALTSRLTMEIELTWNLDNVLGESVTRIPPDTAYAGSPALVVRATERTTSRITSSLAVTF